MILLYCVTGVILLCGAGAVAWHKLGPYHFRIVIPGELYRSGSLNPWSFNHITQKYGIKTVVSLRLDGETDVEPDWLANETQYCREHGLAFYHLPMPGKRPPTADQIKQWLGIMADRNNYPVLLHCAQGVVRTGAMVAIYQIAFKGKAPDEAWSNQPRFGHDKEYLQPAMKGLRECVLNFNPKEYQDILSDKPNEAETAHGVLVTE